MAEAVLLNRYNSVRSCAAFTWVVNVDVLFNNVEGMLTDAYFDALASSASSVMVCSNFGSVCPSPMPVMVQATVEAAKER